MRKIVGLLPLVSTLLLLLFASPVSADKVFHSERLPLSVTPDGIAAGHPQLRAGHIVDIHPDGRAKGAIEEYMINGAKANTAYQVELRIFLSGCNGVTLMTIPSMKIQTVLLMTNSVGVAHGSFVFTPAQLAPFNGMTFGVLWTLLSGPATSPIVAYDTACIPVSVG